MIGLDHSQSQGGRVDRQWDTHLAAAVVLVYSTVVVSVQVPPVNLDSELMTADLRGEVALDWGVAGGSRGPCSLRTEEIRQPGTTLGLRY